MKKIPWCNSNHWPLLLSCNGLPKLQPLINGTTRKTVYHCDQLLARNFEFLARNFEFLARNFVSSFLDERSYLLTSASLDVPGKKIRPFFLNPTLLGNSYIKSEDRIWLKSCYRSPWHFTSRNGPYLWIFSVIF